MIYTSSLLAAASGSAGGCTFSRCRGASYVRARAVGVNPTTPYQTSARAAFAELIGKWGSALTPAQRDGWSTWAKNVPQRNRLGVPHTITGCNAFLRANALRRLASLSLIVTAPAVYANTPLTPPRPILADASTKDVQFELSVDDPWNNQDDAALLTFMARPQNASLTTYASGYKLVDVTPGTAGSPSPVTAFIAPNAFAAGQRIFLRHRAVTNDGRISAAWTSTIIATP